jgi:hypothetical protein
MEYKFVKDKIRGITTIKRCQSDPDWWFTVEDTDIEDCITGGEPGTGLTIRYFDANNPSGTVELRLNYDDTLLIRDAISQLYPSS